jgi:hypothetical protein
LDTYSQFEVRFFKRGETRNTSAIILYLDPYGLRALTDPYPRDFGFAWDEYWSVILAPHGIRLQYLIDRIKSAPRTEVLLLTEVVGLHADVQLRAISLRRPRSPAEEELLRFKCGSRLGG